MIQNPRYYSGEYRRLSRGRTGFVSLPGSLTYFPVSVEHAIYYITSESSRIYKLTTCSTYRLLGSIVVSIPACHAGDQGSIPCRGVQFIFLY